MDILNLDFLIEIVIKVAITLFLILCLEFLRKIIQEGRSGLTEKWKINIYNTKEEIVKQDSVNMKHRGKDINGKIKRVMPDWQSHRKWEFIGKKHNDDIFIIFISDNENIPSSGCARVHLEKDFRYEGFYFKIDERNKIIPVKIVIEKEIDANRNKVIKLVIKLLSYLHKKLNL